MSEKFIDSYKVNDYEILTDDGFIDIISSHKTIPFIVWKIETENYNLRCADDHILFDENFNEIFVKNLICGQKIQTEKGIEKITKITETKKIENMYDLELPYNSNHRYFTNGILSHNTMSLISLGASYVRNGYNVLYVTLEMSEQKIAQIFDANFIEMEINDVPDLSYNKFKNEICDKRKESYGELIIKEFPTGQAGTSNIRNLVNELKLKQSFIPQIIIVDYINLMRSDRYSEGNSYTIIKAIAEELRGLFVETETAGLSVTQLNRDGAGSSNPSMRDTAESYGLPATADLLIAMYTNEELEARNILIWKSLKNRFGGIINHKIPIRTRFEFGMVDNLEEEIDGIPYIKNSEKSTALMKKMKTRSESEDIDNHDFDSNVNSLFD